MTAMHRLIRLQDASRDACRDLLNGTGTRKAYHRANGRYARMLFAVMRETGRDKRLYDDIEAARSELAGAR